MSTQSYFKQFSLTEEHSLVLFEPYIGPYQVLQLQAKVDLGAMVIKGCSESSSITGTSQSVF